MFINPITISIISLFVSAFSAFITWLNRQDGIRPHLYSYIKDERNDEGKINREIIIIKNFGKVPGLIININLKADTKIYSFNKQYEFEQPFQPAKNNHINIDTVLKNRCENKTILPDHSIIIELNDIAAADKRDLEKLETRNEIMKYKKETLQNVEGEVSIKIKYKKAKKTCFFHRNYYSKCILKAKS